MGHGLKVRVSGKSAVVFHQGLLCGRMMARFTWGDSGLYAHADQARHEALKAAHRLSLAGLGDVVLKDMNRRWEDRYAEMDALYEVEDEMREVEA